MDANEFEQLLNERIDACRAVLIAKRQEYANGGDRLQNFRTAAELSNVPMRVALGGMLAKHTVSIHDMLSPANQHVMYSRSQWSEKIGDALNYLFLLHAVISEELDEEDARKMPAETTESASAVRIVDGPSRDVRYGPTIMPRSAMPGSAML